jgi:ceramide glucosyltransferase
VILEILCALAIGYQLFAILACLIFRNQGPGPLGPPSFVSVLKPVHGVEPSMREAIASHTVLEGNYEFLCGVRDSDPALKVLARFPKARAVPVRTETPNGKVGALIDLEREARHALLVVNDADIRVEVDYLLRVTAPLVHPDVGLVTCLYRAEGSTFPARFEGLGIATDFAPSALVARLVGVDDFAMGSTMAFRRLDLERIGGFEAIADYLADDYQLGRRIHALGLRCVLSDVIVTTHLAGDWHDVWRHQVRWARTIRVSNLWGYLGLPVTFATLWALLAWMFGHPMWALATAAARMLMAMTAGWSVLRARDTLSLWPLIPLRDLFGFAVWIVGLFGDSVMWRGERLRLDREGRIRPAGSAGN